jgi:hypothetical protein
MADPLKVPELSTALIRVEAQRSGRYVQGDKIQEEVTMRRLNMLIVMTAMVLVAAGTAKGNTSPGPMHSDRAVGTSSEQSSLPMIKSGKSLSGIVLPAAHESTVGQLFVAATAEDGDKNPPPRSIHCPPDKEDHHDINYRDNEQNGGDNQANDNKDKDKDKDKDHHDNCGKGDDGKNP